jgi:hypothetical protein
VKWSLVVVVSGGGTGLPTGPRRRGGAGAAVSGAAPARLSAASASVAA